MSAGKQLKKAEDDIDSSAFEVRHILSPYYRTLAFHSHDSFEIYLFLSGSVSYYIEDAEYELQRGDLLIIPPGSMHRPVVDDPHTEYERAYMWIGAHSVGKLASADFPMLDILNKCSIKRNFLIHYEGAALERMIKLFDDLISVNEANDPEGSLICRAYLTLMFVDICRAVNLRELEVAEPTPGNVVQRVIGYINDHLTEDLNLDDLAEKFYISKFHLIREFKKHTNKTLYAYIISKRIILSKQLIRQGVPPSRACYLCGFHNYSNFYKAFISETDMTPKEFLGAPPC